MNRPTRPPSNRQRVEDYYGVHETGMGPRPAQPGQQNQPAQPVQQQGQQSRPGPQDQPGPQAPGQARPSQGPTPPRRIPPPEEQVAAKAARGKPDPLTDPLTSETFNGIAPEPDTFASDPVGVTGGYGYSATTGPSTFEDSDPFAPPKFEPTFEPPTFEPPKFERREAGTGDPQAPTLDEPDESYIDVEVVDVVEVTHSLPEPLAIDPFPYTTIDESYVDESLLHTPHLPEEPGMADFNESLSEAMNIDGALGVALVDSGSGMALATAGDPAGFNLEVAAAGNSALVQAMGRTLGDLDLDDHIEDILITLGTQYQIVRPIRQGTDDLFLYLVLDRSRANLAMARFRLTKLAEAIEL
ncbi:hypothetical protein GCM10027289_25240 [Tsukamurella serpentis]